MFRKTETNDKNNDINLRTNMQVAPATKADNDFVQEAKEKSKAILPDKIKNIHAECLSFTKRQNEISWLI